VWYNLLSCRQRRTYLLPEAVKIQFKAPDDKRNYRSKLVEQSRDSKLYHTVALLVILIKKPTLSLSLSVPRLFKQWPVDVYPATTSVFSHCEEVKNFVPIARYILLWLGRKAGNLAYGTYVPGQSSLKPTKPGLSRGKPELMGSINTYILGNKAYYANKFFFKSRSVSKK
jgi:hypothetical protein